MLYNTAKFWREADGTIWHSLSRFVPGGGTTDLTMGPVSNYEKTLAWAKSHGMKITDKVAAC